MSKKTSPHRRRSIAVLGHGPAKATSRRRAYSIAPGERLSPAAKARRLLAPRKSILKASINLPPQHARPSDAAESSTSGATEDSNMTQTMDFTQVHGQGPRKSLARRVSFAAHTHTPDSNSPGESSSPAPPDSSPAFITRAENDENAIPGPSQPQRRVSFRRRSSGRSMDMDMDDTAPLPQDFLHQNRAMATGSADEDNSSDMEVTEAIARNIERKRSLSLGGNRARSSISENQQHHEGESFEHDGEEEHTTSTAHTGSSFASEGSSGEPMEFTIPPDPLWLQLRAMTHAGNEPYEPPPPESDDDAVMIQPSSGHAVYGQQHYAHSEGDDDGEQDMDLTSAMTRLQQARASLGLGAPTLRQEDSSFTDEEQQPQQEEEMRDDTADLDNRTINLTQRTSLGTLESSMDDTDVLDGVVRRSPPALSTSQPAPLGRAPAAGAPSVFSAPTAGGLNSSVFSAPPPAGLGSSVFSAPSAASIPPSNAPRSPTKSPGPATIPKPFNFTLPRAGTPSKSAAGGDTPSLQPHRDLPGSDADQPSPAKRAAVGRLSLPTPTAPPSSSNEPPGDTASQPVAGANASRRTSMIRRPAGYFAQRKSLGGGVLPAAQPSSAGPSRATAGAPLRSRASVGGQPSAMDLGVPLVRTHSDPGPAAAAKQGGALYPDLAQLANEAQSPRTASPVPATSKGKECDREASRQAIAVPSPTRGSPAPAPMRVASPALPQRVASPKPAAAAGDQARERPVTHIEKPAGVQPRIIDVSMAMDVEQDASIADGGAGVSQAWRESVPEEPLQDDEGPAISIEQFFQMTDVRFMDELTIHKPRRSTVLPGQLRPRARRRSSSTARDLGASSGADGQQGGQDEEAIPLAEFAVAMAVDMPRLDLYTAVARDLTAYIQECKKIYREAEEEALKVTPSLFKEFASVDETEQAMLIHQLKLIKANNIGTAKSQWYDWKLQWVEQLYESAAQGFANLESDATYLAGVIKEAQDILPALREEYAEVTRLLEQEQADIDEIENSDKDFLNELKATIAEQSTEIEAFRADVSEAKAKLERLEEKLEEVEAQKEEATTAISKAKHIIHIQKESTSAEVFRLKDELEALQDLHLWRPVKHTRDLVEFIYASKYHVSLPCRNYKPILSQATVIRNKQAKLKERDAFPQFTDLVVRTARSLIVDADEQLDIKQVIGRLGDFWSSCAQLRSQLTFLAIKYPLSVEALEDDKGQPVLHATATVMFPQVLGKAFISFLFDRDTYSRWPLSVRGLKPDVQVAYGAIQYVHIRN
ncbi:hypothetical protein BV20DRAFT_1033319 [Pilatotrama ljubarskyi]|nr:hypothetical protein BV20DRAFT_1033319 [Pilatotrama ljubarskyi]